MAAIAVFLRFPETGPASAISIGMGLTGVGLRLTRLPQRPSPLFSAAFGLHREAKKPSPAAFHFVSALRVQGRGLPLQKWRASVR